MRKKIKCCKDCVPPKRCKDCHSTCKEYLTERAELDKTNAKIRKENSQDMLSYVREKIGEHKKIYR